MHSIMYPKVVSLIALSTLLAAPLAGAQPATNPSGQLSITSDAQEANTKTGEIVAIGNVHIDYPIKKVAATADRAVYLTKEKKIILTGNVRAVQDKNRINSETLTYFIVAGVFKAEPKDRSKQVESFITIPPEETPSSSNPK
jgi:lipopolysaccharide export system protein LptA